MRAALLPFCLLPFAFLPGLGARALGLGGAARVVELFGAVKLAPALLFVSRLDERAAELEVAVGYSVVEAVRPSAKRVSNSAGYARAARSRKGSACAASPRVR